MGSKTSFLKKGFVVIDIDSAIFRGMCPALRSHNFTQTITTFCQN